MVQGLSRLRTKLTVTLPRRVEAATRKAMETGADELVAMMKRLVPVDDGDLRDSIGWKWGAAPKGAVVLTESEPDARGMRITIYAGNEKAYYARWVEFGVQRQAIGDRLTDKRGRVRVARRTTRGVSAQPFFFPSWRSLRNRIRRRITREMRKAVQAEFPAQ